jgi:hypothetical protein
MNLPVPLALGVTPWMRHRYCMNLTPRPRALGERGRITPAAQFTDKGGAGLLSAADLIHIKV